jgi:hypothetical protein
MSAPKVWGWFMKSIIVTALMFLPLVVTPLAQNQSPGSYPFTLYPAQPLYKGRPAPPKLTTPSQREFRTVLRKGAQKGPNFDGHYTVVEWGCGSNCVVFAIVDAVNGKVYDSGMPSVNDQYPCGLLYRPESRLFVIEKSSAPNGDCKPWLYAWDGTRLVPVRDATP